MDLKVAFHAIGKQMLADFEGVHTQIKHAGKRGSERELGLMQFLQSYLPARYALSSGEIVDVEGNTSHECDLVIYDPQKCPLLLASKDYRVFPAEPVFAIVEVKSVLTTTELEDAMRKIAAVKKLRRRNGSIAGIVFAYKSGRKTNPMSTIASHMIQRVRQHPGEDAYVDLLCVLDSGLILFYGDEWTATIARPSYDNNMQAVETDDEMPALLFFFANLLDLLDSQLSTNPEYKFYTGGGGIGTFYLCDANPKKYV